MIISLLEQFLKKNTNNDDEDEIIVINESDSQTVNNCTKLVGYSDSGNEDEKQDGSEESNSEVKNENQDGNNIPILNDENEIEIVLITE